MSGKPRDYAKEYREYHAKPEQVKNRAQRNAARREFKEANPGTSVEGKDVHHKKPIKSGGSNSRSNLAASSVKANRGWRKGKTGY